MDTNVRFRRGGSNLPRTCDGYVTLNTEDGRMYVDLPEGKRVAVNGTLYGVSNTAASSSVKTLEINGVTGYYEGMLVQMVFNRLDHTSDSQLFVVIQDTITDTTLSSIGLFIDIQDDVKVTGKDLKEKTPYLFAYNDGCFILVSGGKSGGDGGKPVWEYPFEQQDN